jgi:pimeloyl-ACP methyl ester carboxylesterase
LSGIGRCGCEALKSKYRLILPDTRDHGASDKSRDPQAYTPANFDITSVLDGVGVSKAVYWGYSQGGWIGFALAQHALVRIAGFVMGRRFGERRLRRLDRTTFPSPLGRGPSPTACADHPPD